MADVSAQEYQRCARQFESMPNLIRIMVDAGKLPPWATSELGTGEGAAR